MYNSQHSVRFFIFLFFMHKFFSETPDYRSMLIMTTNFHHQNHNHYNSQLQMNTLSE